MTLVIVAGLASASVFAQSDKAVAYHEKPDTPAQYSSPDKPSAAIFPLNFQRRPSFSGGPLALLQFLGDHLTYPEVARRQGQEGIVRLRLTIDPQGDVTRIQVNESAGQFLDAEAIRVASLMPRFVPARQGNFTVTSYFYLPIAFSLE